MKVRDCDTSAGTQNDVDNSGESGINSPEHPEDLDVPQRKSKSVSSGRGDEKQATTGRNGNSSPQMKASTPRRRNNMVANLKSSLSPKYIGFATSPSSGVTEDSTNRQHYLRRRKLSGSADRGVSPLSRIQQTTTDAEKTNDGNETNNFLVKASNDVDRLPALHTPVAEQTPLKKLVSPITDSLVCDGSKTLPIMFIKQENTMNSEHSTIPNDLNKTTTTTTAAVLTYEKLPHQRVEHFIKKEDNYMQCDGSVVKEHLPEAEEVDFSPEIENINAHTDKIIASCSSEDTKSPSTLSTDSAKGSSILNGNSWSSCSVGDLFWGQLFTYCYWPCMVCPDPDGKITQGHNADVLEEYVHVRFFADNARRNWLKRRNLLTYNGYAAYKSDLLELRDKYGKNSSKLKVFLPKQRQKNAWHEAIREADIVAQTEYVDRLEKFYYIYERKNSEKSMNVRRVSMLNETFSSDSTEYGLSSSRRGRYLRENSSSPCSPAYSPVKTANDAKRFRTNDDLLNSGHTERHLSFTSSGSVASMCSAASQPQDEVEDVKFNTPDFMNFYTALHDYVYDTSTSELHVELVEAARKIWCIKLSVAQLKANERSEVALQRRSGQRLSSRLKNLKQKEMHPPPVKEPAKTPTETAKKPPTKKIQTHADIEEVIDDIFNMDPKVQFRGLSRDPLCKYCLQPGIDLKKCAKGNCQTWLHLECLAMTPVTVAPKDISERRKSENLSTVSLFKGRTSFRSASIDVAMLSQEKTQALPLINEPHITGDSDAPMVVQTAVLCRECSLPPKCVLCDKPAANQGDSNPLLMCNMPQCSKYYHEQCCKHWPQSRFDKSQNTLRCPSHVCHTCVSDDPHRIYQHLPYSKMIRCVKCPATYHPDSTCIPAGTQILNAAHLICPRHNINKADAAVNVGWCFICVKGGNVICCDQCPSAVHERCMHIQVSDDEVYICDDCESGRLPMYGDIVWAKFNAFRWWPAIILPPLQVPDNITKIKHNPWDFVVRFLGTHDHGWISRRRVHHFVDGDSAQTQRSKKVLDKNYVRGVEEAKRIYHIVQKKKDDRRAANSNKTARQPQPFRRVKNNVAVPPLKLHTDLEMVNKCECKETDENPCGPDTSCLNRVLFHECNPKICPAGERCENRMFEAHKSPRIDVAYMNERGFGLMCRESIAEGTFIIEYVGEVINHNEFEKRVKEKTDKRDENFYFLLVEKDYIIDAEPKGNEARFMNHSCDPNCETQKWSVKGLNRVGLFAIKDIPENTELTFNYHWDDLFEGAKKTCYCGAAKCTGAIGGKHKEDKTKPVKSTNTTKKGHGPKKPLKRLTNNKKDGSSTVSSTNKKLVKAKIGDGTLAKSKPIAIKLNLKLPKKKTQLNGEKM